jgi:hypothetical protein
VATQIKRTIKNEVLKPFSLSSENPWVGISYRFDDADPWKNALSGQFYVLPANREDVRTDALHSFLIHVDPNAIRADGIDPEAVDLIVLTRDGFAKKVVKFLHKPLAPEGEITTLSISREALTTTSLSGRVDFEIMLVARTDLQLPTRKIRRGGRLATHTVGVSAEKKGHSFHFAKTKPEEFVAKGLPSTTTFYLDVLDGRGLIDTCDDVAAVLSVLVHEDAWSTLQEIQTGDRIGEAVGAMFLADIVLAVLLEARSAIDSHSQQLEEGSVTKRLLDWIAEKGEYPPMDLEQLLASDDGVQKLQAIVQQTLRLTNTIQRVRLGEEQP